MTTTAHHAPRPARARRMLMAAPEPEARSAAALRRDLEHVVEIAAAETAAAEHALRASELARRDAGRALEQDLRPLRIDEAARSALRADYAAADADVDRRRRALEKAARLEQAAREIVAALSARAEPEPHVAAEDAGGVLLTGSRLRDAVSGPRIATA